MADISRRAFQFHSQALADGMLNVLGFTGVDRINHPFRFELELASSRADHDATALLTKDAWLGIKQSTMLASGQLGSRLLKIHGVLCSFELHSRQHDWFHYQATLVPRLWRSTLSRQSRIFQDQSTTDIIKAVLTASGFGDDDYEFRTSARSYPNRGYVVQYQETDLDFINRLTELEGISYFFEHKEDRACLVFGDQGESFQDIPGATSALRYNENVDASGKSSHIAPESVFALRTCHQAVAAQVVLGDFDYGQPSLRLEAESTVDADASFGIVHEHAGNVFISNDAGSDYAKIRAEEIAWRQLIFRGHSDARGLRAGAVYALSGHFSAPCNCRQLLIEVHHEGRLEIASGSEGDDETAKYSNRFVAIPADVPFRPARITPKPVIHGTIHAQIDAAGSGQYAELDDQGRYRIRIPFDRRPDTKPAEASAPVRMIQPYAGDKMGMHAPLHKGTEVLLTHVEGDPDRPVIAGAVPNPETSSMVQASNQTQSVWRSGGQNSILFEDSQGAENVAMNATKDMSTTIGNSQTLTVTADQTTTVGGDQDISVTGDQTISVTGTQSESVTGNRTLTAGADDSQSIAGKLTQSIGANHVQSIGADQSTMIGASQAITVAASRTASVAATDAVQAATIILNASSSITLQVGGSTLVIKPSSITLSSTDITLLASGNLSESGAHIASAATGAHGISGATVSSTASSGANSISGAGVAISGGSAKVSISGSSVEHNS